LQCKLLIKSLFLVHHHIKTLPSNNPEQPDSSEDATQWKLCRWLGNELSLRLNEQHKLKETTSEFALMTNKVTSQVSAAIKSILD
jgi:hypothetical protein